MGINRTFLRLKVQILCWLGLAIDIRSRGRWPSYALSNLYHNSFELDGMKLRCMEAFLQGIKCHNDTEQLRIFCMRGKRAKFFGAKVKGNKFYDVEKRGVYWNGETIDRHSQAFQTLLRRTYRAMFEQCPKFRDALTATGGKRLYHTIGKTNPHDTILTERELCTILTELRNELNDNTK